MMRRTWAIALWICAIAVLPARCQAPWKTEYASIYELEFFDTAESFDAAKALCDRRSAIMLRMDNEQVRNKVYATIKSATSVQYFWIGATGTMYNWTWLGESTLADMSFVTWVNSKPDNNDDEEHNLVVVKGDGAIGDVSENFGSVGTICQKTNDPWKTENASIYKLEFFDYAVNFDIAREICTARSAIMIRMDNEQVRDKVYAAIKRAPTVKYFWIGAIGTMYNWTWLGKSTLADMSFVTWVNGKPDNNNDEEHNLVVVKGDGTIGDVSENLGSVGTICQKTLDSRKTEVASNYKLEYFDFVATFDNAKELCTVRSGMMIRMDDEEIRTKVIATIKRATTVGYFWIGATRENGEWKWLGETTPADTSFITWASGTGQPGTGGMKNYLVVENRAKYTNVAKNFSNAATICQIEGYCRKQPDTCQNGGSCSSTLVLPFYSCNCTKGYSGRNCQHDYCQAHSGTCHNGGTCNFRQENTPPRECICARSYSGEDCAERYCDAHGNPCKNSGTCSSTSTSPFYSCQCADGYYGSTCLNQYCTTYPTKCENGGTCLSITSNPYFTCKCADGYYGDVCRNQYCDEHPKKCGPAGNCSSQLTSPFYYCQCDEGYHGDNCKNGVTNFNGYRLETVFEYKTFDNANSECKRGGGILFEPRSETMNNAIKTLLKSPYGHFIGLRYQHNSSQRKSQWQWESDNSKATYTNWKRGFPKKHRYGYPNHCVRIVGLSGKWENIPCVALTRNYACQTHGTCNTAEICLNGGECLATKEAPYYKCRCSQGYYKQNCTEYLKVTYPGEVISVVGDELLLINSTVNATEERVNVNLYKSSDKIESVSNFESNATVHFRLSRVNNSTEGNYTISAKTISGDFTTNVSFTITVHEKAVIKKINPRFVFAPVTNGSVKVVCKATGIPKPSVSWYRGTLPVENQSSTAGVYQTYSTASKSRRACLHISSAKLSDNGTYTCKATNRVGPSNLVVTASDSAFLAVYGKPTIQNLSPEKCSAKGSVKVLWAPNNQTTGVVHRLRVQSLNATISDNATQMTANNNVEFDNLLTSTKYELQVTVCPDECINKLNATTEFTTGVGLAGELHNTVLKNNTDSSVCIVSWNWTTTTPTEQISHVEVTWKASLVFTSENNLKDGNSDSYIKNVTFPILQSDISTLSNRDYSVSLRAFTCAGPGPSVTADGKCVTEAAAPTEVKKLAISNEVTSDGFRTINVALPDESNGQVSCILVMMTEESDSAATDEILDENTIRKASFSELSGKPQTGESYIAIAIPRANFTTSTYASKIGDDRISYCDVHDSIQNKRSKRELHETGLRGKNWPLSEGSIYSYFTVTTTPTSSGHVHFARSESASFVNDQPFQYTLIIILIIAAVIIVGVSAYGYYRYRNRNKGEIEERPEEEATYENIVLDELNSGTAIPVSKLLDVYKAMKADKSLKFHKGFQELKLQAETVMTPATFAGREEMAAKNRYKNILPFDATRVVLQGEEFESYINACHITGKGKDFIATQGPLPITVVDFWKMVVEQNVKIIVMLAKCREAGKHKCAKYWPDVGDEMQHGNLKIENSDVQYFGAFVKRTFKIFTPQEVQRAVLQFQFLSWPDHGVPVTTSSFFRLHKAVMDKHEELGNDSPLLVHCSAGVGRTGTFIGYDILLHESNRNKCVDIFACLLDMRRQRVEMVQTSAQYELLHKLLLENFMFGESDITKDDLVKMQLQMRLERKRIEKEFQNLSAAEPLSVQAHGDEAGASTQANFGKILIVRQPEDTEWILIDASRVEACDNSDLIAAHGPFRSTSEYFWRAVLDNNVETIVMLNRVGEGSEDPQTCAIQYWPDSNVGTLQFNNVTVQIMGEQLSGDIWKRNLLVSRRDQPQKAITHFQYLGWPSGGVPENTATALNLASKIPRVTGMEKPGAVLIHCSDGLGRTGAFCTILNIIARMKIENHVDVFRAVKDLRDYRPGMVKTLEEYTFCYKAAQAYLEASNIYTNVSSDQGEQQIYENLK